MKENNNKLSFGNVTTVVNSIIVILAGYLFGILVSHFGSLPITESEFVSLVTTVVFAIFAYINAKYHNDFWNSEEDTLNIPLNDLNEQETKAIKNFLEYVTSNKHPNCYCSLEFKENDPTENSSSTQEINDENSDDEYEI